MYKSEMARARAGRRAAEASARRALKHKMNQYDRLSNRSRSLPSDFSYNGEKTTNDILLELAETMSSRRENRKRKTLIDKIVPDVVSPEVQQYWRDRIARGGIKF